ncbi:PAS domain S-box protein [Skermanella mucosa]|uniref:sensor histidine kinase n=1 Tax=Skermanella mucosa TaxID=1789672 RepID=UPI00192C4873|nr:histidine kinase dimerization/phosphoacceptor domain -containing protein [Skermanella mucosa]UEM18940.1 PAS domain S-box protein [Skermanella mucosa]
MSKADRDGEHQFRLLADNAPVMIWRSDLTKACDFFNKPWLEFSGRTMEEELGFGWAEGVHPEDHDRCVRIYTTSFDTRECFTMPYRLRRHDGEYRWLLDNGRPYHDADGSFAGYFGSCIDITDMKQALDDKDVLLREVHHRVRNNMQLISSLLEMQASTAQAPEARSKLQETAWRVRSIALAQEQLHEAGNFSNVDLGDYVRSLILAVADMSERITFEVDVDQIPFPLDRAVPTGLIVNELLTNSLKHAFPGDRAGTVRVEARRGDDGTVTITISDDGVGLPSTDLPERARSLGYRLVKRLGMQAGARISVENACGTRHRIVLSPA